MKEEIKGLKVSGYPVAVQLLVPVVAAMMLVAAVGLIVSERDPDYVGAILLSIGLPTLLMTRTTNPAILVVLNLALAGLAFGIFVRTQGTVSALCAALLAALAGRFSALADIKSGLIDIGSVDHS